MQEISLETMKENIKYWVSRKTFQKVPLSTYEAVLTSLPTHFGQSQKKIPNIKFWQKNCKNTIFFKLFLFQNALPENLSVDT